MNEAGGDLTCSVECGWFNCPVETGNTFILSHFSCSKKKKYICQLGRKLQTTELYLLGYVYDSH